MLYVIHQDRVDCGVVDLEPCHPGKWIPGGMVQFTSVFAPLSPGVEYAILASMGGVAWHLEILAVVKPDSLQASSRISARVLRSLKADDEILRMIQEYVGRVLRGVLPGREEAPLPLKVVPQVAAASAA